MGAIGPIAVAGACLGGLAAYAVNGRSSQLLAPSLHRGSRKEPFYSLSFDDGPSSLTPRLLDLLDSHKVRATFFVLGHNAARFPSIVRDIVARGHEVGNHGYRHPYYFRCTPKEVYWDIVRCQLLLEDLLGFSPWLYRPPYGLRWPGMAGAQRDCGLLGVQWSLMPKDWAWDPNQIAHTLARKIRPGDIVCLHDGRVLAENPDVKPTITAVRAFLLHRASRWLQALPVSELLGILPAILDDEESAAGALSGQTA
jgi:peptidoglycan-N-acetylglucosamine deacetylase